VLAIAGLLTIWLVPTEPDRWVALTYTTLGLYVLYTLGAYALPFVAPRAAAAASRWDHWIDVGWYLLLISMSHGTNSVFFFGFFLPILAASFRWGFRSGLRVTVISACLFVVVGYVTAPDPPEFDGQRFLIRPTFLLALGYMIASRGGFEMKTRQRLEFLRDVVKISNPRFGVDRIVGVVMHRLRDHYDAEACVVVAEETDDGPSVGAAGGGRPFVRRVRRGEPEGPAPREWIQDDVARRFLSRASDLALAYGARDRVTAWPVAPDGDAASIAAEDVRDMCESIATMLEAESFLSVPFGTQGRSAGRIFLCFRTPRSFDAFEIDFFVQVVEHAFPVIEYIRLVNQLATSAAVEERRRIARDIHDSIIQPYVGIQMGLAALRHSLDEGRDVHAEVEGLLGMSSGAIDELRRQVWSLREGSSFEGGLLPALSRFAERFSQVTGIAVDIVRETEVAVEGPAAAEVFQIVAESLNNVWRHTRATRASVFLAFRSGSLVVRVENDEAADGAFSPFMPKSLRDRTESLGGQIRVSGRVPVGAVVEVNIPL
jgi:signal transduction histidine kinase